MSSIPPEMMGDVWPVARPGDDEADYGSVCFSPQGSYEVRSFQCFTLTYTVGEFGLDDTGAIKIVQRFTNDGGRWQFGDPCAPNYVTANASSDVNLELNCEPYGHQRPWDRALRITVSGGYLVKGDTIAVVLGDRSKGSPGLRLQTFCETEHVFKVLVDPCATGHFIPLKETPSIEIVAGEPHLWKAVLPTLRRPGEHFVLGLKAEDRWGNPSAHPRQDVSLEADGIVDGLPENVRFTGEQRALRIEGLRTADEGTVRITARDEDGVVLCRSNPLVIRSGTRASYWGDLHGQSGETVGVNSIEEYFEFARDLAFLDVSSHQANDFQITKSFWQKINDVTAQYNESGRFVVYPGYEWSGNTSVGGDHNVFFCTEGREIHRSSHALLIERSDLGSDARTVAELFDALRDENCVLYAHVGGRPADIQLAHDPRLRTSVEVHSDWGTFEWIMKDSFALGHRPGLVCNSDGHKGRPGASYPGASQFGAYGGLTCFIAEELSREAIFECLRRRHHYGTTGCRMHLDVKVKFPNPANLFNRDPRYVDTPSSRVRQAMMGDIVQTDATSVELEVEVAAQEAIERIDVMNGSETVQTIRCFEQGDLGSRIRVHWQGAEYRGRGRQTRWIGDVHFRRADIQRMNPINAWNPDRKLHMQGSHCVEFDAITTGNFGGLDLWLKEAPGATISVATNHVSATIATEEIGINDVIFDAGGLERCVRLFRLPDALYQTHYCGSQSVELKLVGDNPIWVKITTIDGYNAWSSPLYLFRESG